MRASRVILLGALFAAVLIIAAFAVAQATRRADIVAEAERNLQAKSDLLAFDMERVLEVAKLDLRAVNSIRGTAVAEGHSPEQAHEALKGVHDSTPVFLSLFWTESNGARIASSFSANPPPASLAQREHFLTPRDDVTYAKKLFLGKPVYAKALKSWILAITLRQENAAGAFDGIVGGTVDPAYLSRLYERAGLGQAGVVRFLRNDGVVLAQHPYDIEALGKPVASIAATDGPRLERSSEIANSGVQIVVSQSEDAALTRFIQIQRQEALLLLLFLILLAWGAWTLSRMMDRRETLEAKLREREVRTRQYAQASSDWFWETGADGRLVYVSPAVERSLGLTAERLVGQRLRDMLNQNLNAAALDEIDRAFESRESFRNLECRSVGRTQDRVISISGLPIVAADGTRQGYRGSATDVTEQRLAEQRFEDVVASFPGRVLVFDPEERLVLYNDGLNAPVRSVRENLQYGDTFEQMARKLVAAGLIDDAAEDPEGWIASRTAGFRSKSSQMLLHMGDKVVEAVERPMADGGTVSLRIDVTDRERAREEAEQARSAAEAANQAKSEFLASMSHELRTPLNAVIGFSQMLRMNRPGTLTETQKEYIDHVEGSGQHLLNLVSEVLDLAGIEAGRLKLSIERVATAPQLEQIVATMRPVADRAGVELAAVEDVLDRPVLADVQRLRQVIINLLSNAIKYNRPGGSVRISAMAGGDAARILIEDNGIGIPAERHGEVFTPFNRLGAEQSAIEGAGIGLSLCKRLVEAMNGRIGFSSAQGAGSTFWIELPLGEPIDVKVPAALAAGSTGTAQGGYSLLYVEDNPSSLKLMEHLIDTLPNVTMYSAPSGAIGIELARAHRPDLIVLDINLPGMSGFDTLKILRDMPETWTTPVIALSAAARPTEIERGLAAGFYRYVTKPLDVSNFLESIEAALASRDATRTGSGAEPDRRADGVA